LLLYISPLYSTYEIPSVEYLEGPTHLNVRQNGLRILSVVCSHVTLVYPFTSMNKERCCRSESSEGLNFKLCSTL